MGYPVAGVRGRLSGRPGSRPAGRGRRRDAVQELRTGIKGWRDVGAPYEVARAQLVLSRALRALEDEDDADLELEAALDEFSRLGAKVDIGLVERERREITDRRSGPQTARLTFMFTDIVGSTSLAEALGDAAWERLLRWHDDMLRDLVAAGRGRGRELDRRRLLRHVRVGWSRPSTRRSRSSERSPITARAGFALSVRIGLHAAEATRRGDRLQRDGHPCRRPDRGPGRGRRDPRHRPPPSLRPATSRS